MALNVNVNPKMVKLLAHILQIKIKAFISSNTLLIPKQQMGFTVGPGC